jgi:NAD(P)H-hydrate epimerase
MILLSAGQMRAVERAAMADGVSSTALMEAAGAKTAEIVLGAWTRRPAVVLCGPGNNGGDGFVVARLLAEAGWPVKVALLGAPEALKGDAKGMADRVMGAVVPFSPAILDGAGLIVDAIFGTGLSREVSGAPRDAIEAVNAHPAPALAVDLPSGVDADTGAVHGVAVQAERTVTFHGKKLGHVLFPGRALAGRIHVADIGVTARAAQSVKADCFENAPPLWASALAPPDWRAHKYHRGHVFAVSGPAHRTGAARLAALGAQRIGAGLTTVLSPRDAMNDNAAHLTSIMLRRADSGRDIAAQAHPGGAYRSVVVIGPAGGVGAAMRDKTLAVLASGAGAVLDADALTSFADGPEALPEALFGALRADDVLTPHGGEFARLFGEDVMAGGKLAAARAASRKAGCVVLFKGADTVIAAPDGRAAVNVNAPPELATAGAGDVLAGFIAGLKAQGMPGFEAACAGAWIHGACAQVAGLGLIAEDLISAAPAVLRRLLAPLERERSEAGNGE